MEGIFQNMHPRIEAQLPLLVLHLLGYANLELDIHLAVPLGHIPEPGFNDSGVDDIRRHHFAVFVLDGLHDDHLPAVIVVDNQRIWSDKFVDFSLGENSLLNQSNLSVEFLPLNRLNLTRRRAALCAEEQNNQYQKDGKHDRAECHSNGSRPELAVIVVHVFPVIRTLAIFFIPGFYLFD